MYRCPWHAHVLGPRDRMLPYVTVVTDAPLLPLDYETVVPSPTGVHLLPG